MILSNYWKALHSLKDVMVYSGESAMIDYGMVGLDGNAYGAINMGYDNNGDYSMVYRNVRLRSQDISMRVGTGTGEISADDYSLFNDCTASISNLSVTNSYVPLSDGYKQILTIAGTNSTSEPIIITEAGITKTFCRQAYPYEKGPLLLAKMLLDNPITVAPKDNFMFSIEWKEA